MRTTPRESNSPMSRSTPISVLGEVDQGGALLDGVLNIGRGAVASEMVGLSEEVFGRTVTYLKERKQFGKLIGEFQALQHRAAELYIDIEITRAAVLKALQTLDGDFDHAGARSRSQRPAPARRRRWRCRRACRCTAAWA
jgi:alkylation response protein AidB-like acyl-CoA dehydrogenase